MNEAAIFRAIKARNAFLEKHPHLKPLQSIIDARLNGAVNSHNRIVILNNMMRDNLKELERSLVDLQKTLEILK